MRHQSVLINRALSGDLVVIDFEGLRDDVRDIYHEVSQKKTKTKKKKKKEDRRKKTRRTRTRTSWCGRSLARWLLGARLRRHDDSALAGSSGCCCCLAWTGRLGSACPPHHHRRPRSCLLVCTTHSRTAIPACRNGGWLVGWWLADDHYTRPAATIPDPC
jgi:hypothetical protein